MLCFYQPGKLCMDMRACTGYSTVNNKLHLCAGVYVCVLYIFQSFLSLQKVIWYKQQSTRGLPSCRISIHYLRLQVCVCVFPFVCSFVLCKMSVSLCRHTCTVCEIRFFFKKAKSLTLTPEKLSTYIIHLFPWAAQCSM